jgi:YVTN family beta-propeller protein
MQSDAPRASTTGVVPDLNPGDVFAGHRITGVAGRGGMGVVYRAVQLDLDRAVALKLIAPQLAEDQSFRERFVRESRLAASIDHPNVIPIYYTGEEQGALYIAMRYVEGSDLRTLVRAAGHLGPERAAHIVAQVGSALDAAHERGIVHRDVKPANVLLGSQEHAYLTDFGLTKRISSASGQTHAGGWVGTLGFVAPEQIRGERVDARADVYALGCVLFHTLAGGPPYRRDSDEATLWAHLHEDAPSLRASAPDAPPELQAVIDRALAKEPDERFQSAGDLGRAALAAVGREPAPRGERVVARGAASPAEAETAASPDQAPTILAEPAVPRRGTRRPAWVWALAAIPVLALGAVAAVVLSSGGEGGAGTSTPGRPGTTPTGATTPDSTVAGTVRRTIKVDGRPNGVVVAGGLVWVLRSNSSRLITLRPKTGRRAPYHPTVGPLPAAATSLSGRLWVASQRDSTLVAIGLRSHKVIGSPIPVPVRVTGKIVAVSSGERGVWVGVRRTPGGAVRVSPTQRTIVANVLLDDSVQDLAVGAGAVWVLGRHRNAVTRVDVATGEKRLINVGQDPAGVAVGEGAVWVTNSGDDTVTRIDQGSLVTRVIGVGDGPNRVATGGGAVWVANRNDSTLTRIDPETNRPVGDPVEVGSNPFGLDVSGHQVWVTSPPDGTVQRIDF